MFQSVGLNLSKIELLVNGARILPGVVARSGIDVANNCLNYIERQIDSSYAHHEKNETDSLPVSSLYLVAAIGIETLRKPLTTFETKRRYV